MATPLPTQIAPATRRPGPGHLGLALVLWQFAESAALPARSGCTCRGAARHRLTFPRLCAPRKLHLRVRRLPATPSSRPRAPTHAPQNRASHAGARRHGETFPFFCGGAAWNWCAAPPQKKGKVSPADVCVCMGAIMPFLHARAVSWRGGHGCLACWLRLLNGLCGADIETFEQESQCFAIPPRSASLATGGWPCNGRSAPQRRAATHRAAGRRGRAAGSGRGGGGAVQP